MWYSKQTRPHWTRKREDCAPCPMHKIPRRQAQCTLAEVRTIAAGHAQVEQLAKPRELELVYFFLGAAFFLVADFFLGAAFLAAAGFLAGGMIESFVARLSSPC